VLAPRFIADRCREQGWAPDQEMALLVVHGCLHILGWEHDEPADRRAMMDWRPPSCAGAVCRIRSPKGTEPLTANLEGTWAGTGAASR